MACGGTSCDGVAILNVYRSARRAVEPEVLERSSTDDPIRGQLGAKVWGSVG